ALVHWHRGHQFCGVCGSETQAGRGGHDRACLNSDCGKVHFPRTDPAVIMLVTHPNEDSCLLGHNKKFQGLRYSTIAGFVEPGEMLEQAVAREVYEETNIQVVDVEYKASQPWPFPASIMLGFRARAISTEIICHDQELVEAKWFSREEVLEMADGHETLPPTNLSISRWLIDGWLYEK
ncbi:MAG: NAD(+) diphosphatase, partial [Rhodospirillaceae bacterium]|nr:NAD(+) diphosphatase [Rhodospirillaceae bacterium]